MKKAEITTQQKKILAPFVAFELTALFLAWFDVIKAPSFRHGNRVMWFLICLIQPIGPWLYLWLGKAK